jgi:hypothetical protein
MCILFDFPLDLILIFFIVLIFPIAILFIQSVNQHPAGQWIHKRDSPGSRWPMPKHSREVLNIHRIHLNVQESTRLTLGWGESLLEKQSQAETQSVRRSSHWQEMRGKNPGSKKYFSGFNCHLWINLSQICVSTPRKLSLTSNFACSFNHLIVTTSKLESFLFLSTSFKREIKWHFIFPVFPGTKTESCILLYVPLPHFAHYMDH